MGSASGSEVDWEFQVSGLRNLEDTDGSLSVLFDHPSDLSIADTYLNLSTLEVLDSSSHILEPVAGSIPEALDSSSRTLEPVAGSIREALHAKRHRSKNWTTDEKRWFAEAKLEAVVRSTGKGKEWKFISRYLKERHGLLRSAKECEYFWGTLRKDFRAICRHESSRGGPQTSDQYSRVSYFDMDEESRSRNKFLPLPCYQLVHTILEEQNKRQRSTAALGGPSHTVHSVAQENDNAQLSIQQRLESFVTEQVEDAVNSSFESLPCRKTCPVSKAEQDQLWSSLAPDVKKRVEAAAVMNLKILASSGYKFDVDDPIAGLAAFVEKFIKDALKSAIESVSSAMEALERKKLESQKRLRDIYEKRRALDLEEKEIEESERLQCVIGRPAKRKSSRRAQQ